MSRKAPVDDLRGGRAEARAGWLMVAPALLAIAAFFALPLVAALLLSLTDFDIYAVADPHNMRFVALKNYAELLRNPVRADEMGAEGRSHVRDNFLSTRELEDWLRLFRDLG